MGEENDVEIKNTRKPSNKKIYNILKNILFISLGILLLILAFDDYLFDEEKRHELISGFYQIEYQWVIYSMLFGFLAIISRGLRWVLLINSLGYTSSKVHSIYSVAIGYLSNTAIPRSGEITRCTSLNQKEGIPMNRLLGTVVLERIIDLVMLIALLSIGFVIKFEMFMNFFSSVSKKTNNDTMLTALYFFFVSLTISIIFFYFFRKKFEKYNLYKKLKKFFSGFKDGISSIKKIDNKLSFWLHTLFIWVMYFLMTYICFLCIPETENLTLADGMFIMLVGGLGMVFPSPGGIGSYHFLVSQALMIMGVGSASGILFATTVHTAQTLIVLIFGLISLFLLFTSKNKNANSSTTRK